MIPATKTLACSPRGICTLAILDTAGYISAIAVVVLLGFGPMHHVALRVVHPLVLQRGVYHNPLGTFLVLADPKSEHPWSSRTWLVA